MLPTLSDDMALQLASYDFSGGQIENIGRPRWHLLETLRVPSVYRGLRLVYLYDDGIHDDFDVSDELKIEYYD